MSKKRNDWMPSKRADILFMAKNWTKVLPAKQSEWKIPEEAIANLSAAALLTEKEDKIPAGDRSKVSNTRLRIAFRELIALMRDIKRRYYFIPPLIVSDLILLGLKPKDTTPTPVADPTGFATATVRYLQKGTLELHIRHLESTPMNAKANYGYRVYYGVYAAGETLPEMGKDLRESRFTRQKKMLFTFEPEDSGKTAYFCIRYENSKGKAGQWGQLFSAIIP